ncbi:hypothetical protein [Legionella bononiensis]|uniref:Neuromedin U n=1 Tax=Legionella bononiensis TaxID=2793102 RepID=A0ABS1WDG6_9GAMM|nr:hypothetical protein [Legionella bononiensis]MBL7481204.1 hypothetical protein [Legionella bononiensis]MBL7527310.1 hypothetical protein [Legionella bononiensis]MBL7562279.1 hypothetical protein [Legionella bononiensis]
MVMHHYLKIGKISGSRFGLLLLALCCIFNVPCVAQDMNLNKDLKPGVHHNGSQKIAVNKEVQDFLAPLKSLSIQEIDSPSTGVYRKNLAVVNALLIHPLYLSSNWNIITRTYVPVAFQPPLVHGQERIQGTSNLLSSVYFSPKHRSKVRWGVGPVIVVPTASNSRLGVREWGAGPSLALVKIGKRVVSVLLLTQLWTNKDEFNQRTNQFIIQPIINYNFSSGLYLTSSPIITADWQHRDHQWIIPVGGGVGKVLRINKEIHVNLSTQAFYHVEKPEQLSPWTFRVQAQFFMDTPKVL